MKVNFLGVEFLRTERKFRKRKKMLLCVVKPSAKHCISNFHVKVVQGGKGNVPKTHSERAKLLYGFLTFSLPSPSSVF